MDLAQVMKRMGVSTAKLRERNTFKIEEFAMDYWSVETGYEECEDINMVIQKLKSILVSKINEIKKIIQDYDGECGFCIVVKSKNGDLPAIYFDEDFVSFAATIRASINMDFI